ncbi:hypothetical protein [Tenacibaculum finnmarkense]|uniref:hypothetical protein n=1 Tax=Tenacibaculum finnmarkense TaxID=2781243 RepID=UPI001E55E353|nr:hypothetical protein [Tenacibaculum finnmarkense]MCD8411146.1 hypothetical protein [Tenacibaculum finnmarkense genomovar ulcerans]MCG8857910.1 hypothetical protein [Tenacibaculum finnmarkense]
MELTQEQIQCVENFLSYKKLDYIDVRFEVLDHIISDIESLLEQGIPFEDAFKQSTGKWHNDLEFTSSFLLGAAISRPKIVMDKSVKIIKPYIIILFILSVLLIFLMGFNDISLNTPLISSEKISKYIIGLMYSFSALVILGYIHIKVTKQKTTYRFLYETQVLPMALIPLAISYPFATNNNGLNPFNSLLFILSFFLLYLGIKLYKQHFLAIKKYTYKCN